MQFDDRESRHVEAVYLTPDVVAQRTRALDALGLRQGERVADLGCGPGLLALEIAHRVGVRGEVQGIDASASMLMLAARRCHGEACVQLALGDVARLPYPDAYFDAAICTQVYEYVADIERALRELHRVLRPGGRAVLVDTDWESCVWHSSDPARMRKVIEAWDTHCAHPRLPRTLSTLLRSAHLETRRIEAIVLLNDRYDGNTYSFGMLGTLAAWARKRLDPELARAWADDLRLLGERDEYFFSLNRYLFEVVKM